MGTGRSFGLREMADPVEGRFFTFLWPRALGAWFFSALAREVAVSDEPLFYRCAGSFPGALSSLEN